MPSAYQVAPPEHELPFDFSGRKFVACLWWCKSLDVWDTVVYEIPPELKGEEFRWVCSGVSLKRFKHVQGKCSPRLADAISEAVLANFR